MHSIFTYITYITFVDFTYILLLLNHYDKLNFELRIEFHKSYTKLNFITSTIKTKKLFDSRIVSIKTSTEKCVDM